MGYCENSLIQASGSIVVTGRGSYESDLMAGSHVIFKKTNSVVRGGILIARKGIRAGIIGSSTGITTYCRILDANGEFKSIYCFSNTILNINGQLSIVEAKNSNYFKDTNVLKL